MLIFVLLGWGAPLRAQSDCCAANGGVTGACSADGHIVCQDGTPSAACLCQGLSPTPPALGQLLTPAPTPFGNQLAGSASAPVTVTLANLGAIAVTVTSVSSSVPDEFVIVGNNCQVVPAGGSCTIGISFRPAGLGARSAAIRVVSSGVGSPQSFAVSGTGAAAVLQLVEYYHRAWDHYFVTALADEIAKLDDGTFAGWKRTGQLFSAYVLGTPGTSAVCRFFSTAFDPKSSHFYTPNSSECTAVRSNPVWSFEGEVFGVVLPSAAGACSAGTVPLYRLYNNGQGGAPNHRYTTDLPTRNAMLVFGWISEGMGNFGVIACVPG
jgi:hypothetical protein